MLELILYVLASIGVLALGFLAYIAFDSLNSVDYIIVDNTVTKRDRDFTKLQSDVDHLRYQLMTLQDYAGTTRHTLEAMRTHVYDHLNSRSK